MTDVPKQRFCFSFGVEWCFKSFGSIHDWLIWHNIYGIKGEYDLELGRLGCVFSLTDEILVLE